MSRPMEVLADEVRPGDSLVTSQGLREVVAVVPGRGAQTIVHTYHYAAQAPHFFSPGTVLSVYR